MLVASFTFVIAASVWVDVFRPVRTRRNALARRLAIAFTWGYAHLAIFAGIGAVEVGPELLIETAAAGHVEQRHIRRRAGRLERSSPSGERGARQGLVRSLVAMTLVNLSNLGFRITSAGRSSCLCA